MPTAITSGTSPIKTNWTSRLYIPIPTISTPQTKNRIGFLPKPMLFTPAIRTCYYVKYSNFRHLWINPLNIFSFRFHRHKGILLSGCRNNQYTLNYLKIFLHIRLITRIRGVFSNVRVYSTSKSIYIRN